MAESFKEMYDEGFLRRFADDLLPVVGDFDADEFVRQVIDYQWDDRGYKQRVSHIAAVLGRFMPADYNEAVSKIFELLDRVKERLPDLSKIDDRNFNLYTLEYGAVLDSYVEQHGMEHYATSVEAIERITCFTSCEFCAHAFIVRYPQQMMKQMSAWTGHEHWAVRRLASEGCRPRLPWAVSLPELKRDPAPIIPILERLKDDPSRFVRLSVANNLNDISKDNPHIVIELAKRWKGSSDRVDRVLKHGCRTLLKQGDEHIMRLFGFDAVTDVTVDNLHVKEERIEVGRHVEFGFDLSIGRDGTMVRLEYAIYYRKANGGLTKKIYKIGEKEYRAGDVSIARRHSFRVVTVRRFYPGEHQVAVIVNGVESPRVRFELVGGC